MLFKKNKNIFFVHISAFTTVASAVFGRTRFSSHAYVGCVGEHSRNYFHKPRLLLRRINMDSADDNGHFAI